MFYSDFRCSVSVPWLETGKKIDDIHTLIQVSLSVATQNTQMCNCLIKHNKWSYLVETENYLVTQRTQRDAQSAKSRHIWCTQVKITTNFKIFFIDTRYCWDYNAFDAWKNQNGALSEWYWQGNPIVLGEKSFLVSQYPSKTPHWIVWDWTQASAMRGRWASEWAAKLPFKRQ